MRAPRETRVAGHFGELIQGRLGPGGPVVLVTLPCPVPVVVARHWPGAGLAIHGAGQRPVTPERARRFLAGLGLRLSGRVALRAAEAGAGLGVSTATLMALARLAGHDGPPEALARAAIRAEGASDPLMFADPGRLLWASRRGVVLDRTPPLPRLDALGGLWGPARRTDPADDRFADVRDLVADWVRAAGDGPRLARIATESARRTLALRGPGDDPTEALAGESGALGWAIAHTGAARALLFAPGTVPRGLPSRLRAAGFRGVMAFGIGGVR